MSKLAKLFFAFLKIGLFTFGGGYAMIPLMEKELINNNGWISKDELLDYYAISQCTPGVIAVNTATFVGYKTSGFLGAIISTAGVVFPSIVIICLIAGLIQNFAELEIIKKAFLGIRVAVSVLVLNAVIMLFKSGVKDFTGIIIFVLTFIFSAIFKLSPIYIIIISLLIGIVCKRLGGSKS